MRALTERAILFERENLARAAGHVDEHPLGLWVRCAEHPQMWTLNQLHVTDRQPDLTADVLIAELDRGLDDARHRRATVADDGTGRALVDGMRAAGYQAEPAMVMVHEGALPELPEGVARAIDDATMRALERRLIDEEGRIPDYDRPVVVEGHAHIRATVPGTQAYAGQLDGVDVCQTTLFCRDGIGQPEDVQTAVAARGRGIAAATVGLATADALAAGCDMVFLFCHADTGPFPLYASLGYRAVGRLWTFTRPG